MKTNEIQGVKGRLKFNKPTEDENIEIVEGNSLFLEIPSLISTCLISSVALFVAIFFSLSNFGCKKYNKAIAP